MLMFGTHASKGMTVIFNETLEAYRRGPGDGVSQREADKFYERAEEELWFMAGRLWNCIDQAPRSTIFELDLLGIDHRLTTFRREFVKNKSDAARLATYGRVARILREYIRSDRRKRARAQTQNGATEAAPL